MLLTGFRIFNLDRSNQQYQTFFALCLLLVYMGGCWFEIGRTSDLEAAQFWRLLLSPWPFIYLLSFIVSHHFAKSYLEARGYFKPWLLWPTFLTLLATASLLAFWHSIGSIRGVVALNPAQRWYYVPGGFGLAQYVSLAYMAVTVLLCGYFLVVAALDEPVLAKRRWKWGLFLVISGGFLFNLFAFALSPIFEWQIALNRSIPAFISVSLFSWILADFQLAQFNDLLGYQQIFGLVDNPVIVTDRTFNIRSTNPKASRLIGVEAKQAIGESFWQFLPIDAAQVLKESIDQRESQGEITLNQEGQTRQLLFTVRPIHSKKNRLTGYVFVGTDTTDIYHAVEKAQSYALQLQRSNSALERFAYVASHDLKEPLRTVNGFAQLLKRQLQRNPEDPAVTDSINYIQSGIERMYALIESVLEIAKHNQKKQDLEIVDLHYLLVELEHKLTDLIERRGATLEWQELPKLWGDSMNYYRLFLNLIENAIKYNRRPDPRVRVHYERTSIGPLLKVADNGPGIEEHYREQIFTMFQRLEHWDDVQGTGIGLAVCQMIVQEYGGKIWVDSSPEGGAQFNIQLPERLLVDGNSPSSSGTGPAPGGDDRPPPQGAPQN